MANRKPRYISRKEFSKKFFNTVLIAIGIFLISFSTGVLGYHYIVKLSWVDAFLNASMILGGMGQVSELKDNSDKIFAGCYALFSGVTFLSSITIFLAPIIHRILQRFHIEYEDEGDLS